VDKSLQNLALGFIADYINRHTFNECMNLEEVRKGIRSAIREHCNDWGLNIKNVYITDFVDCKVHRVLMDNIRLEGLPNG
jgi:hypothetical protein